MAINVSRPSKNQSMPFTADARSEFEAFLLSNGMSVDPKKGLVSDGSVGRAYMEVDGKRKLTGWYQLWLNQSVCPMAGAVITGSITSTQRRSGDPTTALVTR
jgi:hypothetical protein